MHLTKNHYRNGWGIVLMMAFLTGCISMQDNRGNMEKYSVPLTEADWVRNGDPIEFEGDLWYPQDAIDILLDSEVFRLGDYQGVEFFIEKTDVRPYNRLYTKFGRNKFRIYQKAISND